MPAEGMRIQARIQGLKEGDFRGISHIFFEFASKKKKI